MAYTAKCTGTYIGQFTMCNPVEFNKLLNEGYTTREATQQLKTGGIMFASAFYPLYSYTVDGVEYVRASYRLHEHFGHSIGHANVRMKGTRCTVCYDPGNPGDAVVEDKSGKAEAENVEPGSAKKSNLKLVWVAVGIFAAIQMLHFIIRTVFFLRGR